MGNFLWACVDGGEDWVMCFVSLPFPSIHFSCLESQSIRALSGYIAEESCFTTE